MASPTLAGFPALGGPSAVAATEGVLGVRVVVRTPSVETFIQKYSRFVKEDRIFIFTKSSQPAGTRLRFTLELADGKPLVSGEGTVTRVRPDTGDASRPAGMELQFAPTDDASRKIVALMLGEREMSHAPKTGSLKAPPAPAPANLPALPLTAGRPAYDPPELDAPGKITAPEPSARPAVLRPPPGATAGPSPLLRGAIAGQPTNLPKRPGTLARTLMGTGDGPPGAPGAARSAPGSGPQSAASAIAALSALYKRTEQVPALVEVEDEQAETTAKRNAVGAEAAPHAPVDARATPDALQVEAEASAADDAGGIEIAIPEEAAADEGIEPASSLETRGESAADQSADSAVTDLRQLNGNPSALDADSLFGMSGEDGAVTNAGGSLYPAAAAPISGDELSQSFPGLAQAPSFAESWKVPDGELGLVPANPFSEVSDGAIEYFVEWSLERSTATVPVDNSTASFGDVQMRPPVVAVDAELAGRRRGAWIGLGIGLGIGLVAGGVCVALLRSKPAAVTATNGVGNSVGNGSGVGSGVVGNGAAIARPSASATAVKPTAPARPSAPVAAAAPVVTAPVVTAPVAPVKPVAAAPVAPTPVAPAAAAKPGAVGAVAITSHPEGAVANIDGADRGRTPLSLDLPPGEHALTLTLDRYQPYSSSISAPGRHEIALKRPRATMSVTSSPTGGDVSVNGELRGKAPLSLTVSAYEAYTVEVALPGAKPWKKHVYLKSPTTHLQAMLPSAHATPPPLRPADLPGTRGPGFR